MNPPPPDTEVEGIAREIESYVAMHPAAADTLDGIARWWLARPEPPALNHVESAIELLTARRLLVRKPLPDGKHIYAAARRPAPTGHR